MGSFDKIGTTTVRLRVPHGSVLSSCDVTEVAVEAEVEADVAAGEANDRAPKKVGRAELVEVVVVDDVGHEGEQVADEGDDEQQLAAVGV